MPYRYGGGLVSSLIYYKASAYNQQSDRNYYYTLATHIERSEYESTATPP
jgi:hypothetical protein